MSTFIRFTSREAEFASYILEDCKTSLQPDFTCSTCEENNRECRFLAWGRSCEACEDKLVLTCTFRSHEAWTSFLVSPDFRTSDRKFGRDQYSVDVLRPWFDPAFRDNLGYSIRHLELVRQRLNDMEDKEEIRQLLAKWTSEGYYAPAIEHVRNRFLAPAPRYVHPIFER
ncbi:hypothetical protein B0H16DRAFT_1469328 [Mycena metata]|uniref:Uncharacterized protein n=1 Tax=Mycena metata TaxID=1033252 RepID=A0AAD7HZW7_9AGAR|nr:hypothetical protein B0H16DRAFT_1469328 [Mycena metata]